MSPSQAVLIWLVSIIALVVLVVWMALQVVPFKFSYNSIEGSSRRIVSEESHADAWRIKSLVHSGPFLFGYGFSTIELFFQ